MEKWKEEDHPRDGNNQKFVKKGSVGESKTENEKRQELEKKYNDDLPIEQPKKHYAKSVDSAVMNKYSSVRGKVEKYGFATVTINDGKNTYLIRINNSDDDFDYDIIRKK